MAQVSFKIGTIANLNTTNLPIVDGQFVVATNSTEGRAEIYVDSGANRLRVGDFQTYASLEALNADKATASHSKLYYVEGANILAAYDAASESFVQINADTGMTTVAFSGGSGTNGAPATGEVINGASYSPSTRTLTFSVVKLTATNVEYKAASGNDPAVSVEDALDTLNGSDSTAGSVAKAVKDAVEALDTSADVAIASVSNNVVTLKAGIAEVDGVIQAGSGSDITLEEVAYTGAAEDVSYDNTDSGLTATTVQDAIDEVAEASSGGVSSKTIYMTDNTSTSGTDYAKIYKIYQGDEGDASTPDENELIGTINIPKDQFVDSSTLVNITFDDTDNKLYDGAVDVTSIIMGSATPTAANAGKYVKLVFALTTGTSTKDKSPVYISVNDLVDIYTGGSTAEVAVSVDSSTNVITATIVDVDASKITYIAADAGQSIARESVKQALSRLDGSDSTTGSVSKKVKDAIDALDATADATKTAVDGSTAATKTDDDAVLVLQKVVEADGKLSSMVAVEAAVVGTANSRTGSGTTLDPYVYPKTIMGNRQMIEDSVANAMTWGTF